MRVAYRDDPAIGMTVNLIKCWERGEIQEMAMSTSSGPKDYTRNHIFAIFDRQPGISRVLMVRGEYVQSTPFLLFINDAGRAFDMALKEVLLES